MHVLVEGGSLQANDLQLAIEVIILNHNNYTFYFYSQYLVSLPNVCWA